MKRIAWMLQRDYDKDYYNRKVTYYFDDIADFTAVHYTLSRRGDNHFWQDMRRIGRELDHKGLVKKKYYEQANCMDSVVGYVTAFPDVNWLDIANNWVQDLDDWPTKSTPKQQEAYIKRIRNDKLLHEIQASNNKKSIDNFMKMYNNVQEYDKGLNNWPTEYFGKMFGSAYIHRHNTNSKKVKA